MPRIYKGSETILKLLIDVPSTSVIDKIKIALFTDDRSQAMEFYSDSITIYGNIAYLNAPEWTFIEMNDGIINYIAQGECDNKPFIFERQSNYILKSSDGFEQSDIMNGYYTKSEVDTKLENEQDVLVSGKTIKTINGESILGSGNLKVNADLTGYATEQWVKNQGYVTDGDVNDYVGNEIGQLEETINTKQDKLISGTNIKTINGNDILGEGDITIEGGGGSAETYILEYPNPYTIQTYWFSYETYERYVLQEVFYRPHEDGRIEHNKQIYESLRTATAPVIYLRYLVGVMEEQLEYDAEKNAMKETQKPIWYYIPMQYKYDERGQYDLFAIVNKDIVGGGYYSEYYYLNLRLYSDGGGFINENPMNIGDSGNSGDNDYIECGTLQVNGPATFNSEVTFKPSGAPEMSDIAQGIVASYKTSRTMSNDIWVGNLHIGNGGDNRINFTTTNYNVDELDEGEKLIVGGIDSEGNLYEGETKLSDKYATKEELGDINNILTNI